MGPQPLVWFSIRGETGARSAVVIFTKVLVSAGNESNPELMDLLNV